jgi:hypothetical protein
MHAKNNNDYDDLNNSSIRVQSPPVSTNSRYKGITMSTDKTSGNNGGNEDDARNAFYTWSPLEPESIFKSRNLEPVTGEDDPDILFSITFIESVRVKERVLYMSSSTYSSVSTITSHMSNLLRSPDKNSYGGLKGSSNSKNPGRYCKKHTFDTEICLHRYKNIKRNIPIIITFP